jgi:RNA-directed DNA polymerase
MPDWSPQRYKYDGEMLGVPSSVLENATRIIQRISETDPRLPVILTLRHFSILTGVPLRYVRALVSREFNPYKTVYLRKHVPGRNRYRIINIPEPDLLDLQTWIVDNILQYTKASRSSFAYHPKSRPVYAANEHCRCKWLVKVDIEDFFHNVSESQIYRIFHDLGYPSLLSFELARIATIADAECGKQVKQAIRWTTISDYNNSIEGVLPQGSPTSPMLSNIAMKDLDHRLYQFSNSKGFVYTRYSDDLIFSTKSNRDYSEVKRFKRTVIGTLIEEGFDYNRQKTVICGPGTRKIVLGMLVDGPRPKLPIEDKDLLRQHLYFLTNPKHGPSKHAQARKTSVSTLYHHVRGKIAWAEQIEPAFGSSCLKSFNKIKWPPFRPAPRARR